MPEDSAYQLGIDMGPRLNLAVHILRPIIARFGDRPTVDNGQVALKENGFKFRLGTVQRALEQLRAVWLTTFALELSQMKRSWP
jgi:hypothetical protein